MSTSEETTAALSEQLKKLTEKLDAPKKKDLWDILPILTTFMGTVVLAGISLYVTQSFQRQEADRQVQDANRTQDYKVAESARVEQFNKSQIETQRAQIRVEELKALVALTPLLASHDAGLRARGMRILKAVKDTAAASSGGSKTDATDPRILFPFAFDPADPAKHKSILDVFAIAESPEASAHERVAGLRGIEDIVKAPKASLAERKRAFEVGARIATSTEAPQEVKQAAAELIAKMKPVKSDEVKQRIYSQPITRNIAEVILHHATLPASAYKGAQTIYGIAQLLAASPRMGDRIGWHYAISPDGAIWPGSPLDKIEFHTRGHNQTSVAVMLVMDGDKELPTDAQRSSLAIVLRALFARLKLDANANSPDGSGFHFHRDYDHIRSCPGRLLTKEMVLGWQ